ncbi:MAG: 2-amino-4-hydroxy-6-hydroxymethyldihydropteridine diphosphokinase [Bacillota bacterium]
MNKAYLSLGSNIGNLKDNILKAYKILEKNDIEILEKSSFYKTKPYGYKDQSDFLNTVIKIKTKLKPLELLEVCHLVEEKLKRKRKIHWGPRIIDVDILLYDNLKINSEKLIIPHKEMLKRAFVLVPLREIAPNITIDNINIDDALKQIDIETVRLIDNG